MTDDDVLSAITGRQSHKEIAAAMGKPAPAVRAALLRLQASGRVIGENRVTGKRGRPVVEYWRL